MTARVIDAETGEALPGEASEMLCDCGSPDPYWHGPYAGLREYCCDRCYRARLRSDVRTVRVQP